MNLNSPSLLPSTRAPYRRPMATAATNLPKSSFLHSLAGYLGLNSRRLGKRIGTATFKATALGTTLYVLAKVEDAHIQAEFGGRENEEERQENIDRVLEEFLEDFDRVNEHAEENDGLSLAHHIALDAILDVDSLNVEYPEMTSKRFHAIIATVDRLIRRSVEQARQELHRVNNEALGGILGPVVEEMELDALNHAVDQIAFAKEVKAGWHWGEKVDRTTESLRTHAQERKWIAFASDMKDLIVLMLKLVESDVEQVLETGYRDLTLVLRTAKTLWKVETIHTSLDKVRRAGRASVDGIAKNEDDIQVKVRRTFGALSTLFKAMDDTIGTFTVDEDSSKRVKFLIRRARDGLKGLKLVSKIVKDNVLVDIDGEGRVRFVLDVMKGDTENEASMPIDITDFINRIVQACSDNDGQSFDTDSREMLQTMHGLMEHMVKNLSLRSEVRESFQIELISDILVRVAINDEKEKSSSPPPPQRSVQKSEDDRTKLR